MMSAGQSNTYLETLDTLAQLPVGVDDTPGQTVASIRARIYRHMAAHGKPAAVIIDYLQLMAGSGENRVQEVSQISRGLKTLAKELDCPVVALSQLSRAVEGRTSHVPMLSDLRESGSLEQDADIVMFLYREEVYDTDTDKKGVAELHIAKHRNGPIGVVPLRFDPTTTRFSNLSYRTIEGY
jgi:replicative DNA helicase